MNKPPYQTDLGLKPLDATAVPDLPEDYPDMGEQTFTQFARHFCTLYSLDYNQETSEHPYRIIRIGAAKMRTFYATYRARRHAAEQAHQLDLARELDRLKAAELTAARRAKVVDALQTVGLVGLAAAGLAGAHHLGWDQAVLDTSVDWMQTFGLMDREPTPPPVLASVGWHKVDGLNSVDADMGKNKLDSTSYAALTDCGAQGYVLTECRDGAVYRPETKVHFAELSGDTPKAGECWYYGGGTSGQILKHGLCGEQFFDLNSPYSKAFEWQRELEGTVEGPEYAYTPKLTAYHPVYPSNAALCAQEQNGVFFAPVVSAKKTLPAACENTERAQPFINQLTR